MRCQGLQPRREEERLVGVRLRHWPQPQAQDCRLEGEGLRRLQIHHLGQRAAAAEARVGRLDPDPPDASCRCLERNTYHVLWYMPLDFDQQQYCELPAVQ